MYILQYIVHEFNTHCVYIDQCTCTVYIVQCTLYIHCTMYSLHLHIHIQPMPITILIIAKHVYIEPLNIDMYKARVLLSSDVTTPNRDVLRHVATPPFF